MLGERRLVRIKGADAAVPVFELQSGAPAGGPEAESWTSTFIGREWELVCTDRDARSIRSTVMDAWSSVVGPPGIGKSRLVAEAAELAATSGHCRLRRRIANRTQAMFRSKRRSGCCVRCGGVERARRRGGA